jgi:hypothetical protein
MHLYASYQCLRVCAPSKTDASLARGGCLLLVGAHKEVVRLQKNGLESFTAMKVRHSLVARSAHVPSLSEHHQ